MTACTVFVGPTLPRAQVEALLPHARILPPVRHGDLLRLDARAGDTVLIIDGLFLQTASVRHREILYLLNRGVVVAGSSSMGALRAAELWRFGMRGYGEVFRLYRDGEIDGDDEVAIVHGTAEDGHRAYSDPAVGIRVALRDAAAAGVLSPAEADLALAEALAWPFRSRSFRAVETRMPADAAERFRAWRSAHDVDLKAADARLLLTAAATGDPGLRPAGPGDDSARNVHTWIFDMWEHRYHGGTAEGEWVSDADAGAAIRLFHPGFRDHHRRHVLSWIAGMAPDHPGTTERAVAVARARGLQVPEPGGWLTERDLAGPSDEVFATFLVRAFGAARRWAPSRWDLPPPLRTERSLAAGRAVVLAARRHDRGRPGTGEIDGVVAAVWGCEPGDLEPQAWDRGIPDLPTLRGIAAPFAGYMRAEETISAMIAVMSVT
ncbi:TfuA-like protein [Lentzea sp.]|uniref:TfuA-like protein n=1 Tax=Lentzea sp. TaxID=56099 RepID=UPI002B538AB6|nr:TfuA-like protein [Lentzea sp.]HUQ59585.1 TfuA-like protein [Lentzea sp.]